MAYPAARVANEFIDVARESGDPLYSLIKLTKLVFLAHGYSLAITGKPLVRETFVAWPYGPVQPDFYLQFRNPKKQLQPCELDEQIDIDPTSKQVIDATYKWEGFKDYRRLSEQTHHSSQPWYDAWERAEECEIPDESIKYYFLTMLKGKMYALVSMWWQKVFP